MPGRAELVSRVVRAMYEQDKETLRLMVHPEFVGDLPQSGERSRGFDQFWAQVAEYPGGELGADEPVPAFRIVGDDERWALSPGYSIVPLSGANEFTIVGSTRYPDGVLWHMVMMVELRDEKLYRSQTYFAPELPAPLGAIVGRAPQAS